MSSKTPIGNNVSQLIDNTQQFHNGDPLVSEVSGSSPESNKNRNYY